MELVLFIMAGVFAGWTAGRVMRGNGFGLPGDVAVGIAGSLTGGYLFRAAGEEIGGGLVGSLMVALGAAMLLLFGVRVFTVHRAGRKVWS